MDKKEEKPAKEKKKKKEKPERKKLDVNQVVRSMKSNYVIESVLGSGGFGDVYKVYVYKHHEKQYAMKTEYNDKSKRKMLNRLKVEMAIFSDIQKCVTPIDKSHFVQMVDKGKTEIFKFIVMDIVSHSLIDIRNNIQKGFTSMNTIIQIGRQTIQSIEALHIVGYIHRDIKPHNFAVGLPPNETKIYMLDFGIAKKYLDPQRRVRVPRKHVKFLGTVKYASIACHLDSEQGRRDDIEVWCYMMIEYFNKDNLRWRKLTDRKLVANSKQELMENYNKEPKLLVPEKFFRMFEILKPLTYTCTPDYLAIHKVLDDIIKDENVNESAPFDWAGKEMDTANKKKKKADEKLLNEDDTHDRMRYESKEKRRRERAEKRKILEDNLVKLYKELDENKTPEQIRAEIRSKMRKGRNAERQKKEAQREEDEDDDSEDSEDDYSDESYEPRRRSKMSSVIKSLKDEPSRQKYESRKKKTGRRSREEVEDDYDRRDRPSGNRKKGSRNTQSSYGGGGGSRMDKVESNKKKRQSRMDKPAEMEKAADAKDKEAAEKKAKEKVSQLTNGLEITGKQDDKKDGSDQKINK